MVAGHTSDDVTTCRDVVVDIGVPAVHIVGPLTVSEVKSFKNMLLH